jgi:CheY-like chemotaxis protein
MPIRHRFWGRAIVGQPKGLMMNERVLVVDDDRDTADVLARLINAFGYEAKAVYSGLEAIEQAAEFQPDMAFIDIGMPDLNGYETVARLRQQRGSVHVILVALTGWSRDEDKRRAYDCGFDLHVVKPITAENLKELLALLDPAAAEVSNPALAAELESK